MELPEVLVLPVSGQALIEELGILLTLMKTNYKPSICLGASGGALVSALGTIYDWEAEPIIEYVKKFRSLDVMRMRPLGPIEGLISKTSFYTTGPDLDRIFRKISSPMTSNMLRSKEIIITAQNNTKGRLEIFSTVKPEESLLHHTNGPLSLVGTSCYISYLGLLPPGEYERVIECIFRSTSSVPVVFPSFKFNGDEYSDGGVSFSSPLSSLLILAEIKEVLYVFPEDIDKPNIVESKTAVDAMLGYLSQISRSNYIHDRCNFLTTLCCGDFSRFESSFW